MRNRIESIVRASPKISVSSGGFKEISYKHARLLSYEKRRELLKDRYKLVGDEQLTYRTLKECFSLYRHGFIPREAIWNPMQFYGIKSPFVSKEERHRRSICNSVKYS